MSHIVTIKTKVTDQSALAAACSRLGLGAPVQGTAQLFSAAATGLIVKLPGWQFPIVADTASGEVKFDNYNGAWGKQEALDSLLQAYTVEKAKSEARRHGHIVTEQSLAGGAIKLTGQVAGAAEKTVEIIVDSAGQCTIQTKGFTGAACRDASRAIEQALGVVQSDKATVEMYQGQVSEQNVDQAS